MKNRIMELAKESLNFTISESLYSLFMMHSMEILFPYYSFLYLVSREFKPKIMVEIGTYQGLGSIHLALGNPEGRVTTIEQRLGFRDALYRFCYNENINNIDALIGESLAVVDRFMDNSIDLLFIDGNHDYEFAKEDYNKYLPKVKENGIILIDDIQLHSGMERFWEEIKEPKFDVNFIRPRNSSRPAEGTGFGVVLRGVR